MYIRRFLESTFVADPSRVVIVDKSWEITFRFFNMSLFPRFYGSHFVYGKRNYSRLLCLSVKNSILLRPHVEVDQSTSVT